MALAPTPAPAAVPRPLRVSNTLPPSPPPPLPPPPAAAGPPPGAEASGLGSGLGWNRILSGESGVRRECEAARVTRRMGKAAAEATAIAEADDDDEEENDDEEEGTASAGAGGGPDAAAAAALSSFNFCSSVCCGCSVVVAPVCVMARGRSCCCCCCGGSAMCGIGSCSVSDVCDSKCALGLGEPTADAGAVPGRLSITAAGAPSAAVGGRMGAAAVRQRKQSSQLSS